MIKDFLENKYPEVGDVISKLENEFTSHDFIKKFAKRFEKDYINFLNKYNGEDAFRKVHSQIAKFLAENADKLKIKKTNKTSSENVFGEMDEIQAWEKI